MATIMKGKSFVESLMRENSFKGLFGPKKEDSAPEEQQEESSDAARRSRNFVKWLSPLANVIASRCAGILLLSVEELHQQFEDEMPPPGKISAKYARNLLEYCCFRALAVTTHVRNDYLSDKDFRKFIFDMMLAWEAPGATDKPVLTIDTERAIGKQAFVRLGPTISCIADPITVHSQFDVLSGSTGGRLTFSVYEKYISELDKAIKTMKSQSLLPHLSKFQLVKAESVVELEGTVTTQPVLQHAGVSTWPGRLTLTDHALYFEPIGVVSYDKAKKFDFSASSRPTVKPELTGPWGARLFDKAILCKSTVVTEPLIIEFPEFSGHARRDYWLAIIRELICAHRFIKKHNLENAAKDEALSRAVLGIARLRVTREVNHGLPSKPETLLTFLTGEELPGGDLIMEALARSLPIGNEAGSGSGRAAEFTSIASTSKKPVDEVTTGVGEFLIGELNAVEKAVMQSRDSSKRVELAQSTIDGVKVDGIETNIAVMKELLLPVSAFIGWIKMLQSWEEPFKTTTFLIIFSYIVINNLLGYVLPTCLLCMAGFMLWFRQGQDANSGELRVKSPASQNAVEQLLALQEGLTELKELLQSCNIFFLKIRAILFSTLPQATDQVAMVLVVVAFSLAFIPLKILLLLVMWEAFTRQTRFRQESAERIIRRIREWWYSVPVVPVRLLKIDDEKKKN